MDIFLFENGDDKIKRDLIKSVFWNTNDFYEKNNFYKVNKAMKTFGKP